MKSVEGSMLGRVQKGIFFKLYFLRTSPACMICRSFSQKIHVTKHVSVFVTVYEYLCMKITNNPQRVTSVTKNLETTEYPPWLVQRLAAHGSPGSLAVDIVELSQLEKKQLLFVLRFKMPILKRILYNLSLHFILEGNL